MSRVPRLLALVAVIALPAGVVLASLFLVSEPDPPRVPEIVRIGESPPATVSGSPQAPETSSRAPEQTQLPPPPPVSDDDDDGGDDGADPDDADEDEDG
ncbi:hypothetical protein [Amycolatopsis aidingensis]|uniref:hypothetical protein n=1 Tax=Amycolatopsis aidingensis TaxID=2842453 RepID=UPI001C0E7E8D|nr:hypothetical protein [Amycolatopsis aidingensis]